MKIAVIGSGYWGSKIASSINNLGYTSQIIDIKTGQTINDIDNKCNAVIVATPAQDHFKTVNNVLDKGLHCLVEKPISTNYKDAEILVNKSIQKDLILMTGHILCYTDFISILKDVCNENEIYNIVSRRLNWGRIQYDISPVIHLAPHDIAVLDYIFNKQEPSDITAKGYRFLAGSYPDYVVADLHYGDFNVQLQLGWYHSRKIRTITTTTSNGHYIWDDVKNTWQFISHYMEGKYQREDEFRNETIKGWSISTPLENEIMHFINCIKNSEQPLTNGEHSLRVTKIVDRIEECIKTY